MLSPEDLDQPFMITPSKAHPSLTLKDYFESIRNFVLKDQAAPLCSAIKELHSIDILSETIQGILIRSEKHGAVYHIACVDVSVEKGIFQLAASSAVSEEGRKCLSRDFHNLKTLNDVLGYQFLPRAYSMEDICCKSHKENPIIWTMMLSEWLEDFYEWHLALDQADRSQTICIWDTKSGKRHATAQEGFEIFRQTSKILTLAYNTQDFRQIYPWHHAAGDFIVRTTPTSVHVKLTTVRDYRSFMGCSTEDVPNPVISLVYFFLNLTLKIRLDKIDGVGDTIWAEQYAIHAAIMGFFEALQEMEKKGRYGLGKVSDLQHLLSSFNKAEFEKLFESLMPLYEQDDPDDFKMIQSKIYDHIGDLVKAVKRQK